MPAQNLTILPSLTSRHMITRAAQTHKLDRRKNFPERVLSMLYSDITRRPLFLDGVNQESPALLRQEQARLLSAGREVAEMTPQDPTQDKAEQWRS